MGDGFEDEEMPLVEEGGMVSLAYSRIVLIYTIAVLTGSFGPQPQPKAYWETQGIVVVVPGHLL